MVALAMGWSTGAEFTSFTVMVKNRAALRVPNPLSVTRTVIGFVLGPCASVGVQVNTPETGSIAAPTGAPASRLKVRVCAGVSGSVAETVKVTRVFSLMVLLAMAARTGEEFGAVMPIWPAVRLAAMTLRLPSAISIMVGLP